MSWLNVGSLLLGLSAWALPIIASFKKQVMSQTTHTVYVLCSISAAAFALLLQMLYTWYLVTIDDFGALSDTTYAVVFASFVLLVITIFLNVLSMRERAVMRKE
jgi:cytochrome c oxidase subunit 4